MTQTEESYLGVHKVIQSLPNYIYLEVELRCCYPFQLFFLSIILHFFRVYQILPTLPKHVFELHERNPITKSTKSARPLLFVIIIKSIRLLLF